MSEQIQVLPFPIDSIRERVRRQAETGFLYDSVETATADRAELLKWFDTERDMHSAWRKRAEECERREVASPASAVVTPICNVCDQPIQHELVCEDCLSERGYVQSAVVPPAAAEAPHENVEPSEPLVIIENDASIEGPSKPLCWVPQPISEGMARCDRAKGHKGQHSWEKEAVVTDDLRALIAELRRVVTGADKSRLYSFWFDCGLNYAIRKLESALVARAPQREGGQ